MEVEEIRHLLRERYPEFVTSEMDNAFYYKSMEYHGAGEVIQWQGNYYTVLYGWEWINYRGISIYMAELEPVFSVD